MRLKIKNFQFILKEKENKKLRGRIHLEIVSNSDTFMPVLNFTGIFDFLYVL